MIEEFLEFQMTNLRRFNTQVNSSPYAVKIYRALGFVEVDIEQISDGRRYTPMSYNKNNKATKN